MKLKTRLYVTVLAVITFPGVRELLVWLADRIFKTDWAPFYRLWINFAGGFLVVALVLDLLWALWDRYQDWILYKSCTPKHLTKIKYTFKKD